MSERHHESGFTLVEVLVTVLILGLLAAVVFPVVVPQVDKADPTVASNDLANIRTGIEMFQLDVRPTDPGDLEDLANPITTADADVEGTNFNSGQVDRWEGPYIDATIPTNTIALASSTSLTTGFEASMMDDLYRFNSASTVDANTDQEAQTSGADFIAIRILNLAQNEFDDLDDQIDDEDGAGSGRLRRDATEDSDVDNNTATGTETDGFDTVTYYLAVPFKN